MALSATVVIGFLVRFLLPIVLPSIPEVLSSSVELNTPVNSYKSLQEAFFYLKNGINPYDGGVNHHPPLLVVFFNIFKEQLPEKVFPIFVHLLFALVDIAIAYRIVALNRWYYEYNSKKRNEKLYTLNDELIIAFYLFNPLIVLTNLSHSTLPFSLLFITESIHQLTSKQNLPRSMISLAVATYLSLSPVLLLVPLLALAHATLKYDQLAKIYFQGPALFITSCSLLVFFSMVLTSSAAFLDLCYGVIIKFEKIQPNVGLWWYFFTEMFEFFTPFYIGIFNGFSFLFIIPLTIRLFEYDIKVGDSFFAVFLSYLWLSFTKSYPTIGDLGFAISLTPIFAATILPYCRLIYVTGLTLLISLILSPIFYYTWIVLGNGNSNFFYSINLIWGAVHILIMIDFIWAKLVSDYCDTHDIKGEAKTQIRLTQG